MIYIREKKSFTLNNKTFDVYYSNFHYEIGLYENRFDKKELNKFIVNTSKNINILHKIPNIILIKNAEYLHIENLLTIKKCLEHKCIIFILITNKYFYIKKTLTVLLVSGYLF